MNFCKCFGHDFSLIKMNRACGKYLVGLVTLTRQNNNITRFGSFPVCIIGHRYGSSQGGFYKIFQFALHCPQRNLSTFRNGHRHATPIVAISINTTNRNRSSSFQFNAVRDESFLLFLGWRRDDRVTEVEYDKRVESGESDEYEVYNEMLARMAEGRGGYPGQEEGEFRKR